MTFTELQEHIKTMKRRHSVNKHNIEKNKFKVAENKKDSQIALSELESHIEVIQEMIEEK
jgi:L-serine deaminase